MLAPGGGDGVNDIGPRNEATLISLLNPSTAHTIYSNFQTLMATGLTPHAMSLHEHRANEQLGRQVRVNITRDQLDLFDYLVNTHARKGELTRGCRKRAAQCSMQQQ